MKFCVEPLEKRLFLSTTLRIDVGSAAAYKDSKGQIWAKDSGFAGGTVSTNSFAIANTSDDPLYVTRRWGNMTWNLPADNGTYTLNLYFTEPVMTAKGKRKFNVFAEGAQILSSFDLYATAGYHNALVKSFPITIGDGNLSLRFANITDNAIVSGIELLPRVVAPKDTTPPAQPMGFSAQGTAGGNQLKWQANTESDLSQYTILRGTSAGGPFTKVISVSKTTLSYLDGGASVGIPAFYELIATDNAGNSSMAATANATRLVNSPGAIRVNTGGAALNVNGVSWYAGNVKSGPWGSVTGGFAYTQSPLPMVSGVDAPANNALYQTEWTGGTTTGQTAGQTAFTYHFPVGNGNWLVDLHFDELNKNAPGQRIFDVTINGSLALENFDVFASSGGEDRAMVREFAVDVTNNNIDIAFITELENAKVSGIELIPQGVVQPPPSATSLSWAAGPINIPVPRFELITTQVGNKLFAMGGFLSFNLDVTNEVDILDLSTGIWTTGAPLPGAQTHAAVVSDGTYIYVAGGQFGPGELGTPGSNEVWKYDIANDVWTPFVPLPEIRFAGTMQIIDGVLHYTGGDEADRVTVSTTHWAIDLNGGTEWQTLAPIPLGGDHLASVVVNNIWYTIGGEQDHGTLFTPHNYVFAYDPTTDSWTQKASIPMGRSHIEGMTVVVNGKIYVAGGEIVNQAITMDVEQYDPVTNLWTQLAPLPAVRKGGAVALYDGQVFIISGQSWYHVESGSFVGTFS